MYTSGITWIELASRNGHVVVRVAPGGATFHVIVLDDSTESYRVKSVRGTHESR